MTCPELPYMTAAGKQPPGDTPVPTLMSILHSQPVSRDTGSAEPEYGSDRGRRLVTGHGLLTLHGLPLEASSCGGSPLDHRGLGSRHKGPQAEPDPATPG